MECPSAYRRGRGKKLCLCQKKEDTARAIRREGRAVHTAVSPDGNVVGGKLQAKKKARVLLTRKEEKKSGPTAQPR